jgi:Domain of unknown function (DUF222)/HNH endonuclease
MTNSELGTMSDSDLCADVVEAARARAASTGREAQLCAEMERREAFHADGSTSLETWLSANCGHSRANARALTHVGKRLRDLPHLQELLSTGRASFDQIRALVDAADPKSDKRWAAQATKGLSVRELTELARRHQSKPGPPDSDRERPNPERERPSVRLNDGSRTMTALLPSETYAEVRGHLERMAHDLGADGITPYDERLGDALVALLRGGHSKSSRFGPPPVMVVAHVGLDAVLDESNSLGAELERLGLVSMEVARRLACDAMHVVALDDEAGHTMYEGRARRFPTETQRRELWRRDQHCRFPGCPHQRFVQAHHVKPWKPSGRSDLDNLALLCRAHHGLVHSTGWSVSGDANTELTFVSPQGRVTASRPSPLWGTIGTMAGFGEDSDSESAWVADKKAKAGAVTKQVVTSGAESTTTTAGSNARTASTARTASNAGKRPTARARPEPPP